MTASPAESRPKAAARLRATAEELAGHGSFLFFRHGDRFHDPLVPTEWEPLRDSEAMDDGPALAIADEVLLRRARRGELERGIYAPVPIARGVEGGEDLDHLLAYYRYAMVEVADDQSWSWQGKPVAERIREFFLEHLGYHPSIDRYYVEYRVSAAWWDKCYFEHRVTPLLATSVQVRQGTVEARLNVGRTVDVDAQSFRLDRRERLLCQAVGWGEILLSDASRFQLLRGVSEDGQRLDLDGVAVPLAWPEDGG